MYRTVVPRTVPSRKRRRSAGRSSCSAATSRTVAYELAKEVSRGDPEGLGRGLGADPHWRRLNDTAGLQEIPISAIRRTRSSRANLRRGVARLAGRSASRCLRPILVRGRRRLRLIAGERRWRRGASASRRSRASCAPPTARRCSSGRSSRTSSEELNPLQEAAAYQQLIEDFSLTHDDVAARQSPGLDHER